MVMFNRGLVGATRKLDTGKLGLLKANLVSLHARNLSA